MENNRTDSLPEFDTNYIDKLLSGSQKPQEEPAQTVMEAAPVTDPEPEAAVPEKNEPKRPAYLLILAAIALLAVGFLAGSLLTREEAPPDATTVPTTTAAPQFGLIPSYDSWSTQSLVMMATEIPIVWDTPLTTERFQALASIYPVLNALADRSDAQDVLQTVLETESDENTRTAARTLLDYIRAYGPNIPPCRWLQLEDTHFNIYEFTTAPLITVAPSILSHETPKAVLQFNADSFVVDGTAAILQEECNFWFLIQRKENSQAELDTDRFQVLSDLDEESDDVRMDFLPCEEGWIVCGYAPSGVSILLNYNTLAPGSFALSVSLPLPEGLSTEELLRKTLELGAFQRYLASDPANFQHHPLMAALLEREDLIPTALQMTKNNPQEHYATLMALLAHASVQERMTESQKNAFEMLEARQYFSGRRHYGRRPALAITGEFSVCDTYYLSSRDAKMIRDTEADHWFFVGLSSGAIELNDGSWSLEIEEQDPSSWYPDSQKANILLWPAYRDNGGQAQCGWLVAVQGKDPYLLRLTLRDGRGYILGADEITWGEMSTLPET